MKETDYQTQICKIIEDTGFARKLSHRFLIGVPDLLLVVEGVPALLEVKLTRRQTMAGPPVQISKTVTPLQYRFLRGAAKAGMTAGVLSIIVTPDRMEGFHIQTVSDYPLLDPFPEDHAWDSFKHRHIFIHSEITRWIRREKIR